MASAHLPISFSRANPIIVNTAPTIVAEANPLNALDNKVVAVEALVIFLDNPAAERAVLSISLVPKINASAIALIFVLNVPTAVPNSPKAGVKNPICPIISSVLFIKSVIVSVRIIIESIKNESPNV